MKSLSTIFFVLLSLSTAHADYATSVDAKGCWDGLTSDGAPCLKQLSSRMQSGKAIVKYINQCSHRLYGRYCNQRNDDSWECGASGIQAGSIKSWVTYNGNGMSSAKATGAAIPSQDWNCAGLVPNWHEPN